MVKWNDIPVSKIYGILVRFKAVLSQRQISTSDWKVISNETYIETTAKEKEFGNLSPYREYKVEISGCTNAGCGNSRKVVVWTDETGD